MKPILMMSLMCFVLGLAVGIFTEHRLNPIQVYDCETIDYSRIEAIVSQHAVAPLDVEKIKHVRSFTYAPVFQVKDTCR